MSIRKFIFSIILLCIVSVSFGQAFRCDGNLLIFSNQGAAPTRAHSVYFGEFGNLLFIPLYNFSTAQLNAIGFNPMDNFIYGVKEGTNEIVRLKADGSIETIGQSPTGDELFSSGGDCTPDGLYLCHDHEVDQILVFSVLDTFALIDRIDLFWDAESGLSGPVTARLDDVAIDPNNPNVAYAFQGDYFNDDLQPESTRIHLLRINLNFSSDNLGKVTPVARLPKDVIRQLGSLFFTSDGNLFGYGSESPGPVLRQNTLIGFNQSTNSLIEFPLRGPSAAHTDGCACPYNLVFEYDAEPRGIPCGESEVDFTLHIKNNFYEGISNVSLTDTLVDGMIIKEVTGSYTGQIEAGTGVGTPYLKITGLNIPARASIDIKIKAEISDTEIELVYTQAFLDNLPERFGGILPSDDPDSEGEPRDDTALFGIAQELEEFEIDIKPPSTCIPPYDSQIKIAAPVLIPGEQYLVKLRDEEYQEFIWETIIDEQQAFVLDSIPPGTYELFQVKPQSSNCSFAMKDTTIFVEAPNEFLKASASSNSPICEGSTLQFNGTISQGTVRWKGPGFITTELSPTMSEAIPEWSGIYEMTATYGRCTQIRSLEVEVAPAIQTAIKGQKEYCEREAINLSAEGEGAIQFVRWTKPNGLEVFTNKLHVPYASMSDNGTYNLLMGNGFCRDSASIDVKILPAPKIILPSLIETDFCDQNILQAQILGDGTPLYSWMGDGLLCHDCPIPEITLPLQNEYQLITHFENTCRDSTVVQVELKKDKLLYMPNAFSPNFDGRNDFFVPGVGCGVTQINRFQIKDRWGTIVYNAGPITAPYDQNNFWDGHILDKLASEGVYIYEIEIELVTGTVQRLIGDILLTP